MILWFLRVLTYLKLCCFTIFLIVNTFSWVSLVFVVWIFYCFPFTNKWILSTLNVFELLIDMISLQDKIFSVWLLSHFCIIFFSNQNLKAYQTRLKTLLCCYKGAFCTVVFGYIINIVVTLISQGFFSVICQKEKLS